MQNMDHTNLNIIELTDADLEAIKGGNWIGDVGRAILGALESIFGGGGGGLPPPNFSWPSPTNPPRQPGQPY